MQEKFSKLCPTLKTRKQTLQTIYSMNHVSKMQLGANQEIATEFNEETTGKSDIKKKIHSFVEKRRRSRINSGFAELSSLVCNRNKKTDKTTVLETAVKYLESKDGLEYKTLMLNDDIEDLLAHVDRGLFIVVDCKDGDIFFVSKSVFNILNYSKEQFINLFEAVHPCDLSSVKEHLASSSSSLRELHHNQYHAAMKIKFVDALTPGSRRSFFVRIRCRNDGNDTDDYKVLHCVGNIHLMPTCKFGKEIDDGDVCGKKCFVAMAAVVVPYQSTDDLTATHSWTFHVRLTVNGTVTFVDQNATVVLGYLPHEFKGRSYFEFIHPHDVVHLNEAFNFALRTHENVFTQSYFVKAKDGKFFRMQSRWKTFINPYTKRVDFITAINVVLRMDEIPYVTDVTKFESDSYSSPGTSHQTTNIKPPNPNVFALNCNTVGENGVYSVNDSINNIDEQNVETMMNIFGADSGSFCFNTVPWSFP